MSITKIFPYLYSLYCSEFEVMNTSYLTENDLFYFKTRAWSQSCKEILTLFWVKGQRA